MAVTAAVAAAVAAADTAEIVRGFFAAQLGGRASAKWPSLLRTFRHRQNASTDQNTERMRSRWRIHIHVGTLFAERVTVHSRSTLQVVLTVRPCYRGRQSQDRLEDTQSNPAAKLGPAASEAPPIQQARH